MIDSYCLGCQTRLEQEQVVPPQNKFIIFKTYQIPLKHSHSKQDLLQTIVSLINSTGGSIYIGINPKNSKAQGLFLSRKQRDQFKLHINMIIKNVHPNIDLDNKTKIDFAFIPLFKQNYFSGRYVAKIVVHQGQPDKLYLLIQKIKLEEAYNHKNNDQYRVLHSYIKTVDKLIHLVGNNLLEEIYERASHPFHRIQSIHHDCNPQLPQIQIQIITIRINNIDQYTYDNIKILLQEFTQKNMIDELIWKKDQKYVDIVIQQSDQYEEIKMFIIDNLSKFQNTLNKDVQVQYYFQIKGNQFHYYLIQCKIKSRRQQKKQQNIQRSNRWQKRIEQPRLKAISKTKQSKIYIQQLQQKSKIGVQNKAYDLTFTHILPKNNQLIQKFISKQLCKDIPKQFIHYINTITLRLNSQTDRKKAYDEYLRKKKIFQIYGFRGQLFVGINQSKLKICNYDLSRQQQIKKYLKNLMKSDCEDLKFQKNWIECKMSSQQLACWWLDNLLKQKQLKQYCCKGAYKKQKGVMKMKVYLQVNK